MTHNIINETAVLFTNLLLENHITFTCAPIFDGYKWTFPHLPHGDVALHHGTYDSNKGYVESYGMPWDEGDVSICLPYEMVCRIKGKEPRESGEKRYSFEDCLNSMKNILGL